MESEDPWRAARVMSNARGKKWLTIGARGAARAVAQTEPSVVRAVRRSVAYAGENSAPASTFYNTFNRSKTISEQDGDEKLTQITLPGTDHACIHTAVTEITASTCAIGTRPLCEYA